MAENESPWDVMHTLLSRAGQELHLTRNGNLVTNEELAAKTSKKNDPDPESTGTPVAQDQNPTMGDSGKK